MYNPLRMLAPLALIGLGFFSGAYAHDDHTLDGWKTPHGGQLRMAGPYHLELVLQKGKTDTRTVDVYVTDHASTAIPTAGTSAKVIILSEGKTETILQPAKDNRLTGRARYAGTEKTQAIVSFTAKGQTFQARFTPFAVPSDH